MTVLIILSVIGGVWALMRAVDAMAATAMGKIIPRPQLQLFGFTLAGGLLLSVPFLIIFEAAK